MYYMGEKRLGRAPADLHVFQLCWALNKLPSEVRAEQPRDLAWLIIDKEARRLADEEKQRFDSDTGEQGQV